MTSPTAIKSKATPSQEQVILNTLERRANGQINDALNYFAEEFRFKDYGIGLEFHDKKSLAPILQEDVGVSCGRFGSG